jgi:hypothetical protein
MRTRTVLAFGMNGVGATGSQRQKFIVVIFGSWMISDLEYINSGYDNHSMQVI